MEPVRLQALLLRTVIVAVVGVTVRFALYSTLFGHQSVAIASPQQVPASQVCLVTGSGVRLCDAGARAFCEANYASWAGTNPASIRACHNVGYYNAPLDAAAVRNTAPGSDRLP